MSSPRDRFASQKKAATPSLIQRAALRSYEWVNRRGLLESGPVESVFRHAYFLYKRQLEDPYYALTRWRPALFHDGMVLDIGANIGYTATVFARAVGTGGCVHAFEPEEVNYQRLLRIVDSGPAPIEAHRLAVGRQAGSITLWHNEAHHADHRVVTEDFRQLGLDPGLLSRVEMTSVDEFLGSRRIDASPLFIKIDVQGYEEEVCEGMRATLAARRDCAVAIEYAPQSILELGFDPERMLAFFDELGFKRHVLSRSEAPSPIEGDALARRVEEAGYVDLLYLRQTP